MGRKDVSAIMYVLCTLVVLSLHHLLKRPRALEPGDTEADKGRDQSRDEAVPLGHGGQKAKSPSCGGSGSAQGGLSQRQCSCVIHHSCEMPKHGQPSEGPHYSRGIVSSNSKKAQVSRRVCRDLEMVRNSQMEIEVAQRLIVLVVGSTSHQ